MGGGCGGGQYCGQPGNLTCGVSQTEGRRLKGTRVEKKERKILEDFKKEIKSNALRVGDFNTPLPKMDVSSKQNFCNSSPNNPLDQMDLNNIYRNFHPKEAKYTFFSNTHGVFLKIGHMIGHKTSLNKFKKIEIISSIFSDHKGLKLETNLKGKTQTLKFMKSE